MQPVTITIEGREVSGYPGMTILQLARESGIEIPTLCDDPQLTPTGACRLCIVENEPNGALMAACVTPVAAGMVINTHSPRVEEHRRNIVRLMLASHPDSCPVCDKGNRCKLRQLAADMGIGRVGLQRVPQPAVTEDVNPFIERDLSKCVLCARCIRACHELVVEGAIDYYRRGFAARPATAGDSSLESSECTFCGACVAVCPTGALAEKERSYRGTAHASVGTTCPYCGCGCRLSLEIKGGRILRASPAAVAPGSGGALCVRGSYGCDFVHSPDRLTRPLARRGDGLSETSWDEALERVAAGMKTIKEQHGADSLGVWGSPRCTNEENYLLQRFARAVLGTNNIDNSSRAYNASARAGLMTATGFPGSTSGLAELEQSDAIVVIGADPTVSAPAVGYAIKRAVRYRGARLILIEPRRTALAAFASLWLRPRPGTDVALLNSLARVIIDEGLTDEEFISRHTDNFGALPAALAEFSPAFAEGATGVPSADIGAAARTYAGAGQAAIVFGNGITQRPGSADAVRALANLALLTGNFGRGGGGIYALQTDANAQGACDMGALPDFLPGYQLVSDARARQRFEEAWGVSLPAPPGLTGPEMIAQAGVGKLKGLYIVADDPVTGLPGPDQVRAALASLDLLVVQDLFLTDTARLATVVLPAASFAEKEGTFTNFEGRVNPLHRALPPPGESLPDGEIVLRLAARMRQPLPYSTLKQVAAEIERLVPLYEDYTDSSLERAETGRAGNQTHERDLLKGFARFSPVEYVPPAPPNAAFPFELLTGSAPYHAGGGGRSGRAWRLAKFAPRAALEISVVDAARLGITDGQEVRVTSVAGETTAPASITDTVPEGVVFMPVSFPGVGMPGPCRVRIEGVANG